MLRRMRCIKLQLWQKRNENNKLLQRSIKHTILRNASQKHSYEEHATQPNAFVAPATDATEDEAVFQKRIKLTPRKPLAKNFFVGEVDKELLGFPEVIPRDEMANFENDILPVTNYFNENVNATKIETTQGIPSNVLESLKQLGLYGLNIPREYQGKGYEWCASLMASIPETSSISIALALQTHRTVIDQLLVAGTVEQHEKYFNSLASGELVATEAIYEYFPPENNYFATSAEYVNEKSRWVLNGEKAFVITGPVAHGSRLLFLVTAQTQFGDTATQSGRDTTLFLVSSDMVGVKLMKQHLTLGCRGASMGRVCFDQVHLTNDCIVGLQHEGNKFAESLMCSSRLRNSLLGMSMCKELLNELTVHSINTKQCGVDLKDMELLRINLSKAMCNAYAMESMIFFTAGLLDEFNGPDVTLETAMTKYYTYKRLHEVVVNNLRSLGPRSLHMGQKSELSFRNAAQLYTQGESMDTLSMFIALTGLQYAGECMNKEVRSSRNPLFNPSHIFSKFLEVSTVENPKTKMRLGDNLHPSLEPAAQCIEHSVARLQMCVNLLFTRHGNNVIEKHHNMQRLANISSTIFAMFASASRASRSYCIGLPFADHELLIAMSIASEGRDYVKELSLEISYDQYINNDNNLLRLAPQILKSKGYFASHPLMYNF